MIGILLLFGRRLAGTVLVVLAASVFIFLTMHLTPGDPALIMAGPNAKPEVVQQIRQQLGLDQPLYIQYSQWLSRGLQGNLGRSIRSNRPVASEVMNRFPNTVILSVLSMIWGVVGGIPMGVLAARRRGSVADNLVMTVAIAGLSTPGYALALLLILVFGLYIPLFPIAGVGGSFFSFHGFRYYILPSVTLGAAFAATVAKLTRNAIVEEIGKGYVSTARAKGLGESIVVYRHVLKNALLPVMTMTGLQFGYLLGGTVTTETVFAFPGMGKLLMDAILARDLPVIQGAVFVFATTFTLVNFVVDLALTWANPRVRVR